MPGPGVIARTTAAKRNAGEGSMVDDAQARHASIAAPRQAAGTAEKNPRHSASAGAMSSPRRSGLAQVSPLELLLLVLEDRHRRRHAQEAELAIERLLARHRVEDDL